MEVNQCPYTGVVYSTQSGTFRFVHEQKGVTYLCQHNSALYKGSKGAVYSRNTLHNTLVTDEKILTGREENYGKHSGSWWLTNATFKVAPIRETMTQPNISSVANNIFYSLVSILSTENTSVEPTSKFYKMFIDALEDQSKIPHHDLLGKVKEVERLISFTKREDGSFVTELKAIKGVLTCYYDNEWDWFLNSGCTLNNYHLITGSVKPWHKAKAFFEAIDATR